MSVSRIERELVRHAYDNVIERCARLSAFSGNIDADISFEDILTRQRALAIDDIIALSISARRLVTVCGIEFPNKKWRVRKWKFLFQNGEVLEVSLDDYISLGKLFGVIIHCEKLEVIDSDLAVRTILGRSDFEEIINWYASRNGLIKNFKPKILVRSDRSGFMIFEIADLIGCIDEFLLPEVIDASQKHGLYLEDEYRL